MHQFQRLFLFWRYLPALIAGLWISFASPQASAVDWNDPFETGKLPAAAPYGSVRFPPASQPCANLDTQSPLSIVDVVDRVLCQNPRSHEAWANARFQAAQVGAANAPFLPSVSVNGDIARNRIDGTAADVSYNSASATASLSYLLYDFGGREASLENARQLFQAASATQDSVVQGLFLDAIRGYYQVNSTQEAIESIRQAERTSQASLDAATARYKAGLGTPADQLQAKTAHSEVVLNLITAEGALQNSRGALANLMGMDPSHPYSLQPSAKTPTYEKFRADIGELIAEARRRRPDLAAAEAQVKAAQANVSAAQAAGKPSFSVTTELGYVDRQFVGSNQNSAIGLNVSIPLFTGFASTYNIRSAQEQTEARKAVRDQVNLQIGLDVWNAYQNLQTETQSVETSRDLVDSATQNNDVAIGRYKAGVGNIIDVLTAQSALSSARVRHIQAVFSWNIARASLAYAMGQLDEVEAGSSLLPTGSTQ
jgi:outer membrane protein